MDINGKSCDVYNTWRERQQPTTIRAHDVLPTHERMSVCTRRTTPYTYMHTSIHARTPIYIEMWCGGARGGKACRRVLFRVGRFRLENRIYTYIFICVSIHIV